MTSTQDHMRKFMEFFLRSLGTYLGLGGGLTQPSFMVGFPRLVILITYGMRYFTMEAVSLVCTFAQDRSSSTMWPIFVLLQWSLLWSGRRIFQLLKQCAIFVLLQWSLLWSTQRDRSVLNNGVIFQNKFHFYQVSRSVY